MTGIFPYFQFDSDEERLHLMEVLTQCGCAGGLWFMDAVTSKDRSTVSIALLPGLRDVLHRLDAGDFLVVPHLGHFANAGIWTSVAMVLASKSAFVRDCLNGRDDDCSEPEAGLAELHRQLKRLRGQALAPARARAGLKGGRKRIVAVDMERILEEFVDPSLSIPEIAERHGFKVTASASGRTSMTLLRRVKDATGTWSRAEAMEMKALGKWPPSRSDGEG